jgi:hypothetical protein
MKDLLGEINRTLREQRAEMKIKDAEVEADPDKQDDTEWMNDYYNQKGYIEGLEFTYHAIQRRLKVKPDFKVKKDHTGIFQFAIYLNGAGKNPKEAWESVQDNLSFDDLGGMPPKSDIKLIDQEPE